LEPEPAGSVPTLLSLPGTEENLLAQSGAPPSEENRYQLLVEAITDYAIYLLDPKGVVVSWNPGAQRMKGYAPEEVIGEHFSRFYLPEDVASGLPARALSIAASEGRFEQEGWRIRKDGTRFWTHAVIETVRSPDGQVIGYAKVTRDLTERKAAEEALKRSQEQFRILVQGVTDYAIFMLDREGYVASWNSGAQRIKGYAPDEIIGEHFSRFYPEEDQKRGEPARGLGVAATEGRFEKEGWRVRKDGSHFWAHVVIDAIKDEQGDLVGFAKVTRDVTERMEAQRALEEAREALFQAQKLEAIGQLTGGVAHDFNNLLMVVLSSLELTRRRLPDDAKLKPLIDNALAAAQRGATLTQRMLAFARRQELKHEEIDLPDLVRGMADLLQRSLGPTIRIETRFPLSLPKVRSDANQLEAALLNLAVNARDAMPNGGPLIISAIPKEIGKGEIPGLVPGQYVCFSVQDKGEGMDEQTVARATEPFFTTKGVGKGTGLGLSMAYGLAEQSGGRLMIDSELGVGTTVNMCLPAVERREEPKQTSTAVEEQPAKSSRRKILVVDDDFLVLMNTTALLEDMGHEVVEAHSGDLALKLFQEHDDIDLLITDQAMPGMTGLQLIEKIRSVRANLPVILATGYAELPEGYSFEVPKLTKPFDEQQLAAAVSSAIDHTSEALGSD
jgi:PAS domain S-box-containing protein